MRQKDNWRNKLDSRALEFLERCRKASAERGSGNPAKWHEKMPELAAKYPQIRELRNIEVLPEFLSYLFQNEDLAKHLPAFNASTGTKTMDASLAKSVDIALIFALALGDTQLRVLGGFGIDFVALVFGKVHSDISNMYFGDAGPSSDKLVWTFGKTLEVMGKAFRTGKVPDVKGKVNVELLKLFKILRKHEKVKLTYRELRDAIAYAGVHVEDEDALRQFIFRAKKKGWLRDDE